MSVIVVGYVPTPEGEAALDKALAHARLTGSRLVVVNTTRGDRLVDQRYALDEDVPALNQRLAGSGVRHDLVHGLSDREPHEAILDTAAEHRPHRCEHQRRTDEAHEQDRRRAGSVQHLP